MMETVRAAATAPLQASWTLASSPGLTRWTTAMPAATQPDTRTHTPPTPTIRSLTRMWARDLTMTLSLRRT